LLPFSFKLPHCLRSASLQPLADFFPRLGQTTLPGGTVAELLQGAEAQFPGLRRCLLEDHGALRQHINIFVNGKRIQERDRSTDALTDRDEQGSWWALPDHGHWTCLHLNLPMIHLVRFV